MLCFSCRTVSLAYKWRKGLSSGIWSWRRDVNFLDDEWETRITTSQQTTDEHHRFSHNLLIQSHSAPLLRTPSPPSSAVQPRQSGPVPLPRPSHRRPAPAACSCTMARWDAEGCRGGLWCQSPTARARAGVALPDSSWAARTMRARSWKTAWGQTWSYMRTTKTQTRWEPYVKLLNFFNVAASLKTVGRILYQEHQIISESSFMVELITFWVKVSLNNLKRISQTQRGFVKRAQQT